MMATTKLTVQAEQDGEAGAPSYSGADWDSLPWELFSAIVNRLQTRIVKAVKQGRWGKVRALQHLLTHSFAARALVVRQVTQNKGKNTPGVDQILWNTPQKKMEAVHALKPRGYKTRPLRRVNIPKSNGKTRPLGIPTMGDRAMQALYLLALEPVAECQADPYSFGFRKARSCADALGYAHQLLSPSNAAKWVLEGDIKGCFDNISHQWLMDNVPTDKTMLQKWLKAGYIDNKRLFPTNQGTPQGGIISPVLANFALDGLQDLLAKAFPKTRYRGSNPLLRNRKVNLIRYADDFVITGDSRELLENQVKPLVQEFLAQRGLVLSPEKTLVTPIEEGFDFLGQNIRRYPDGKVLTTPSKKSVKALLERIRQLLKVHKATTTYALITQLNPIIRGWANYHRHACSKETFSDVDHYIFQALWRWAKRRHPKKNRSWVAEKYFGSRDRKHWCFFATQKDALGQTDTIWLFHAVSLPILRHVPLKVHANPYDPCWSPYFAERKLHKVRRPSAAPTNQPQLIEKVSTISKVDKSQAPSQ